MATKKSRKNPRAQVSLLARYRSPTAFEYVNEECFDLSAGGMFIKSPTPAPTGTLLKLECAVNGGVEMLRGVARVVWLRESESDGQPSGMGVKFVKLEQGSREIIHRILVERGSIEPGELEALRPSVAPAAALEVSASASGGSVSALAARAPTLPPEMRATVPDGSLLNDAREREREGDVEDVTDEVTSAESDPPANASSAPPARVSANGGTAHGSAKRVAAKPTTGRPSAGATQPAAPAKQRTGIVAVLVLVAAAAAAAIVLSRPTPAAGPSPAVTVAVPAPEPATIEPATPEPSVAAPQPESEGAQVEPAAAAPSAFVEPAPARPSAREPERATAVSRTAPPAQPREAEPAEPEPEPAPSPEPVLVATGSSAAPVALTAEGTPLAVAPQPAPTRTPAPAAYVLTVVTTPAGAQVTAAGQAGLSPCRFELGALETKVEVQATLAGYSPAVAVIDRIGFMLDDGRMRRRISLALHPVPQAMPDPEPVAKPSRHRSREAESASEPKPAAKAPAGTPMQAAMECLTTGDNACAVAALEGKARNPQELELLIETYRTLGDSAKAERWMNAYVEKYPAERRANTYRRQLERRQSEGQ